MTIDTHIAAELDLDRYCEQLADRALTASRALVKTNGDRRAAALHRMAELLETRAPQLIEANSRDLARAAEFHLTDAMIDRLRLDEKAIAKMAASVRQIAAQTDPVGQVIEGQVRPNGLKIEKIRVPLGVVLFIYESRPNVTSDAAALCLRSGNALILRGGKEAIHSNTAIASIIRDALADTGLDAGAVQLVETTDRAAVGKLLKMTGRIDLAIPRGGESLIRAVAEQARIPVIKHYAGNCHVYVDEHAVNLDGQRVVDVCVNAKLQRTGVCNAAETLLFHETAATILREVAERLAAGGVEVRACPATRHAVEAVVPPDRLADAEEADWSTEYLGKTVAIKIVRSLDEAVEHINRYGSHHTDAILTADVAAADAFVNAVDSANVMVNCSTRFSDGGEYGLGAEIGISTDKLHARGPMGAADLTTYKWVVRGQLHMRER